MCIVPRYNYLQFSMTQKPTSARRLASSRENGSEGGRQRANRYGGDVLSEWASHGGKAVLAKYGPDYFAQLRQRRKNYPKYSESPVITPNWRSRAAPANGQLGGLARAARYTHECFREWGRLGGIETWTRYGNKFYQEIRRKRKFYLKNYRTRKTKMRIKRECEREARKARGSPIEYLWKAMAREMASQLSRR
jgi:hypothetical protein